MSTFQQHYRRPESSDGFRPGAGGPTTSGISPMSRDGTFRGAGESLNHKRMLVLPGDEGITPVGRLSAPKLRDMSRFEIALE